MKTLRFARECIYIYLLKRRPDANTRILHGENTNARRERESVGEITPFLCESSSLNVRHTFDTFSRENVRERRKSEQTKLRGKAERRRTKTKSRRSRREVVCYDALVTLCQRRNSAEGTLWPRKKAPSRWTISASARRSRRRI